MALVYRHRRLDNYKIFYIGFSKNHRRPYQKDGRNSHWNRIVNKVGYNIEIIADGLSEKDALELEEFLILEYGRVDLSTGNLVNKTSGGENSKHSPETIEKIRQSKLGDKNHQYGKKQSIETIKMRIKSNTGKKKSIESIEKTKKTSIKIGQSKKTKLIDYKTGEVIGIFNSISDACRFVGLGHKTGRACIIANKIGTRKQMLGYSFEYIF